MLEIRLEETSVFIRWPCVLCGGHTDKDCVIGVAYENGKRLGDVCDRCIKNETDGLAILAKKEEMTKKFEEKFNQAG